MKKLNTADIADFVENELLSPSRSKPVVAVTTSAADGEPLVDVAALDRTLAGLALVVQIPTGDPTWELAELLPRRLDVYGGALRIWWPDLRKDSSPYDHPLIFVHSTSEASKVIDKIAAEIRAWAEEPRSGSEAGSSQQNHHSKQASASVDLWTLANEAWRVGDVIEGRVQAIRPFGVLMDLLPGVTGLVHKSEIEWDVFVDDPAEWVVPGEVKPVQILSLDPEIQRIELSIKRAFGLPPHEPISLESGGPPFRWSASSPIRVTPERGRRRELAKRNEALVDELEASSVDRAKLAEQLRLARQQVADLRKRLQGEEDRVRHLEQRSGPELDAAASERSFIRNVRLCYARKFDEQDRIEYPLQKMRVGAFFLESLRELEGIDLEKVIEVCTQVACDQAPKIPGREVHFLRTGIAGAPVRVRRRDGAKAYRCSLQDNSPSARRLHWWRVPSSGEALDTIEFAQVSVHDDFSIPE